MFDNNSNYNNGRPPEKRGSPSWLTFVVGGIMISSGISYMARNSINGMILGLILFAAGMIMVLLNALVPVLGGRIGKKEKKPKIKEEKIRCPKCRAEIEKYYNFCPVCGLSMNEEEEDDQEMISKQVKMKLGMIVSINAYTNNEELKNCAALFRDLVTNVLRRVEDKPQLMENREIRNLFNLYLPKISDVIENYKEVVQQSIPAGKKLALEDDLCQILYKENMALEDLKGRLSDEDIMDISAEIDAIEEKLARDGYGQKDAV